MNTTAELRKDDKVKEEPHPFDAAIDKAVSRGTKIVFGALIFIALVIAALLIYNSL